MRPMAVKGFGSLDSLLCPEAVESYRCKFVVNKKENELRIEEAQGDICEYTLLLREYVQIQTASKPT